MDGAGVGIEGARLSFKLVGGNGFGGSGSMSLNYLGNCQLTLHVCQSDSGKESLSSDGRELKDAKFPSQSMVVCKADQSHGQTSQNISVLTPDMDFSIALALLSCRPAHQSWPILDPEMMPHPGLCLGWG